VKTDETGVGKKLHNEELHNLYSSPYIIRMIKSRRMRLAGNRNVYRGFGMKVRLKQIIGKTKT
jgi:hypothetical protein